MAKRFKANAKYSSEILHGSCSSMDHLYMTVIKRSKSSVIYSVMGNVRKAKRQYISGWGEYVTHQDDRFFAYAES